METRHLKKIEKRQGFFKSLKLQLIMQKDYYQKTTSLPTDSTTVSMDVSSRIKFWS